MGIDAYVHLRVKDRSLLHQAFDEREDLPLMYPRADGSVSIFTCMRFEDESTDFGIRCWLADLFGDTFARVHDDPRGVFVTPDICEPKANTYEGIIAEIGSAGRWIDPTPPTEEEKDARARASEESVEGWTKLYEAAQHGAEAIAAALEKVSPAVRDAWHAQQAHQQQMQRMMEGLDGGRGIELPAEMMQELVAGLTRAMAKSAELGGRISALLPARIWKAYDALEHRGGFDVDDHIILGDGSAIVTTTRSGEDEEQFMADGLGALLAHAGIDRKALGPLPFFRENLVSEIEDAPDFATAKKRLGVRAKPCRLRTFDEAGEEHEADVKRWLAG